MNKPGECKDCKYSVISDSEPDGFVICRYMPYKFSTAQDDWCWQFQPKEEPEPEEIEPEPGYFADKDGNYYHIVEKCLMQIYAYTLWFVDVITFRQTILSQRNGFYPGELTKRITEEEWNRRLKEVRGE